MRNRLLASVGSLVFVCSAAAVGASACDTAEAVNPESGISASASSSSGADDGGSGGGGISADCDPLVPTQCGYPFPSSRWLVDDATTPTKKRVHFGATTLPNRKSAGPTDPSPWNRADGFSPGNAPQ